jgi:hypothetical protein
VFLLQLPNLSQEIVTAHARGGNMVSRNHVARHSSSSARPVVLIVPKFHVPARARSARNAPNSVATVRMLDNDAKWAKLHRQEK